MRRIPEVRIIEQGWKELDKIFKQGDRCADCEYFEGFPGSYDEEAWTVCHVQEEGASPFACPYVKRDDVEETLVADAIEAYHASRE